MYIPGDIRSKRTSGITRVTTSPRPVKLGLILLIDKIEEPVDLELEFPMLLTLTDDDMHRFNDLVNGDFSNFYYFCRYGNIKIADSTNYLNIFEGDDTINNGDYYNSYYSPIGFLPFVFYEEPSMDSLDVLVSLSKYPVDVTAGLNSGTSNYYLPSSVIGYSERMKWIRKYYLFSVYPISLVLVALWLAGYEFTYRGKTYKFSDFTSFEYSPSRLVYRYVNFNDEYSSYGVYLSPKIFVPRYYEYTNNDNKYYLFGHMTLQNVSGPLRLDTFDYANGKFVASYKSDIYGNFYELPALGAFSVPTSYTQPEETARLTGRPRTSMDEPPQ